MPPVCLPPRQRPQRSQRLPPPGFFASVAVRCCPCSLLDRLRCSVATAQAPPVFDRASGRAGEPAGACSAPIDGGPRPTRHGWQTVRESIQDCRGHREACNCDHHTELVLSSSAVPFRWPRAGATGCGSARAPQGRDSRASSVPAPAELAAAKAGGASAAGLCLGQIRGRVQGCSCVWPERQSWKFALCRSKFSQAGGVARELHHCRGSWAT